MPNKKISELAEKFALSGLDLLPIVDNSTGISKKITGNTLARFTNTDLRNLSSAWDSTYSSVATTSADWNSTYEEVSLNSSTWNSAPSIYLALSGGRVAGNTKFDQNVTVFGNLSALGTTTFANSIVSTTSALSVVNVGSGEALNVYNTGTGAVARFIDAVTFTEILHVGGVDGFEPNVGIFTKRANKELTVAGEISATEAIWAGSFYGNGSNINSISAGNITSGVLSNNILPASATFASSVSSGVYYGDGSNLTGVVKTQFFLSAASLSGLGGVKVDNTTIQIDGDGLISYNLPVSATFTASVSSPAVQGMFYGDGSNLTNLPLYFLSAASTTGLGGVKVDGTTITINGNDVISYNTPTAATFTSSVSAPALSGVHFGDGSNLTGVVKTQYAPPANATFTSSVSAPALSGVHFGDGSNLTGVAKTQYVLPIATGSVLGGVRVDNSTIVISPNGTIRAIGGGSGGATLSASNTVLGGIKVDGVTSTVDANGYLKPVLSDITVNDTLGKRRLWESIDTFYTGTQPWVDVATSLDGQYLVAAAQNGLLYIFKDGELAYTSSVGTKDWGKVAVSFNGQYVVATENGGFVWVSGDYGATFLSKNSAKAWSGVAVSSSGQYQTAIVTGDQVYRSSDYGNSWAPIGDSRNWTDIVTSFDGQYQLACASGEGVYLSTNYGVSFDLVTGTSSSSWNSVAISFDGKTQFATETTNFYKSTNYGSTFTSTSVAETYLKIRSSSTGQEILALAASGVVYASSNGGTTWRQRVITNGTSGSVTVAGNGTRQFATVNGIIYKGNTTNYYFDKALSATSFYGDGRNLTNLNVEVPIATSLTVGGVRLDGLVFNADNTGLLSFAFPANATIVSSLSAPALSGTLYGDGRFATNLNASSISSGTLDNSRLSAVAVFATSVSSAAVRGMFYGDGSQVTDLNASSISSGTLDNTRLPAIATFSTSVSSAALSGSFYGEGTLLTNLNASAVTSGTLDNSRLSADISVATGTFAASVSSAALSGSFYGEGRLLTNLNASALTNGTLDNGRLSADISVSTGVFSTSLSAPAVRGMFYGDGSNITGVAASGGFATDLTKLPLSGGLITGDLTITGSFSAAGPVTFVGNTVFASTSSLSVVNVSPNDIPAFYVGQSGPGDIASFYDLDGGVEILHVGGANGSRPNVGIKTSVPNKDLTVVGEISATGDIHSSGRFFGDGSSLSGVRFTSDLTVSLPDGKTFGRYASGDVIPAQGKTAVEVVQMAIVAPINPTVGLTSSTTIGFNQTAISNVLNFSHTINSLDGSVATASLEWRRNNTGSWTVLSTDTSSSGAYTHTLTDTSYNAEPFNYRYVVTDDKGATSTATLNLTPTAYSAPTVVLNVVATSITSPETNSAREKGNLSSSISGSITRNSSNVTLTNYILECRIDGDSWLEIGSPTTVSGSSHTINSTTPNPAGSETASLIEYRIKVVDAHSTTYSSIYAISFSYLIFYGTSSSAPLDSASVRALTNRIFVAGNNPFVLITGTTNNNFTVAVPSTLSVTEVLDLDAAGLNITNNYISSTFNVNDTSSTPISYKVYTLSNSVPYGSSHRHQITRA